jgi:hypothetical protein
VPIANAGGIAATAAPCAIRLRAERAAQLRAWREQAGVHAAFQILTGNVNISFGEFVVRSERSSILAVGGRARRADLTSEKDPDHDA